MPAAVRIWRPALVAAVELTRTAARWGQDVRSTPVLGDRGYYALGMIPVSIMLAGTGVLG